MGPAPDGGGPKSGAASAAPSVQATPPSLATVMTLLPSFVLEQAANRPRTTALASLVCVVMRPNTPDAPNVSINTTRPGQADARGWTAPTAATSTSWSTTVSSAR